jgi:hypothetical protein
MAWLAEAQVQLLSEKWRSTVLMVVVVICIAAIGIALSIISSDVKYGLGAVALIVAVVAKPLALDVRKLERLLKEQKQ